MADHSFGLRSKVERSLTVVALQARYRRTRRCFFITRDLAADWQTERDSPMKGEHHFPEHVLLAETAAGACESRSPSPMSGSQRGASPATATLPPHGVLGVDLGVRHPATRERLADPSLFP